MDRPIGFQPKIQSETERRKAFGRGAAFNPPNRFVKIELAEEPDLTDYSPDEEDNEGPTKTEVFRDDSKSLLVYHKDPNTPFPTSMNIYRGCEHGCSYCYARQYHEYLGLSAGVDFESKIFAKFDAPELLRTAFAKRSWEPQVVSLSGATDVYQPLEARLRLTRRVLEVFLDFRNPVSIITKNALILRDLDIISELANRRLISVTLSITTMDEALRRKLEPRTATIEKRLEAVKKLSDIGVRVGVNVAPIIPGLTDQEVPEIVARAGEAGASRVSYTLLRLPYAVSDVFQNWIYENFPNRAEGVMKRIRETLGGNLSGKAFGRGVVASQQTQHIKRLFDLAVQRAGIPQLSSGITSDGFRRVGDTREMF